MLYFENEKGESREHKSGRFFSRKKPLGQITSFCKYLEHKKMNRIYNFQKLIEPT